MILEQLQNDLKDKGAKPAAGSFMLLDHRQQCTWIDVWLGVFTCPEIPNSAFYVHDFRNVPVVPLDDKA